MRPHSNSIENATQLQSIQSWKCDLTQRHIPISLLWGSTPPPHPRGPGPPRAEVQPLTFFIYRFQEHAWTVRKKINGRCREVAVSGDSTVWMNNLQNFFTAIKCICQPFRSFYRPKWQISLSFHILQQVKPIPFLIPEAWKRYLIPAESPRIGHYREYPPHRSLPVYVIIGSTPFPDCLTLNSLQWNSMRIYTDPRSLMGTGSSSMG